MKCPECNTELTRTVYHGIEIDVCPVCHGIWFDYGELKLYIDAFLAQHPETPERLITLEKATISVQSLAGVSRTCPVCGLSMKRINYAADSNIILYRCPFCKGIWCEQDKIEQLAQFFKGNKILDDLGKALAEYHKENIAIQELHELGNTLSQSGFSAAFLPKIILPLKAEGEISSIPFSVLFVILLNLIIFFLQILFVEDRRTVFGGGGLIPKVIVANREYYRFITSMFIHVNLFHLLGNMLFLWIFGCNVEARLGRLKFLLFYLVCGVCAGLLYFHVNPESSRSGVGSSGAIAGVMGAFFVFFPRGKIKTLLFIYIASLPAWLFLGAWFLWQALFGLLYMNGEHYSPVGWFAHIGGFVCGVAGALLLKPHKRRVSSFSTLE